MNLVDSSGWLEYLSDGPNADLFAKPLADTENLVVPTIVMYEVFRVMLRGAGEERAMVAQAHMQQAQTVDLTSELAVQAATLSHTLRLPMADSTILATANAHGATLWTQDEHFRECPSVRYFAAKPAQGRIPAHD
jgi:predicted nucleic acid-binding protein